MNSLAFGWVTQSRILGVRACAGDLTFMKHRHCLALALALSACAAQSPVRLTLSDVPSEARSLELHLYDSQGKAKLEPPLQDLQGLPATLRTLRVDLSEATDLAALGLTSMGQVVAFVRDAQGCLIGSGAAPLLASGDTALPLLREARPVCGPLPVLTGFTPTRTPSQGGAEIRVQGAGLLPGVRLAWNDQVTAVTYVSPRELLLVAPDLRATRPQATLTLLLTDGTVLPAPQPLRGEDPTLCLSAPVRTSLPLNDFVPVQMWVADIDGDGRQEILAPNQTSPTVAVLRWSEVGGLAVLPGTQFSYTDYGYTVPLGLTDVTGDGLPDMVWYSGAGADSAKFPATVFLRRHRGRGAASPYGGFADVPVVLKPTEEGLRVYSTPRLADADGDGLPDLYILYSDDNDNPTRRVLRVMLNQGGGVFSTAFVDRSAACDLHLKARPGQPADLDGGGADLIYQGEGYDQANDALSLLLVQKGQCQARRTLRFPAALNDSRPYYEFVTADLDGDGDQDVVASSSGGGQAVLLNDGAGRLQAAAPVADPSTKGLWLADVNQDERPDLIVRANFSAARSQFYLHQGLGGGRFGSESGADPLCGERVMLDLGPKSAAVVPEIVIGDFDGDGRKDVIVVVSGDLPETPKGVLFYRGRGR